MTKPPFDHCTHTDAPRIVVYRSGRASAYARNRAFRNGCVNVALTVRNPRFYDSSAIIRQGDTAPQTGFFPSTSCEVQS